jgi:hypothetical protein
VNAQQPITPPPQPTNDAPANTEVLKLLRQGLSERVVLHLIAATPGKFDTSADALATLKQAGATDAEINAMIAQSAAAAVPPPPPPADNGPSLETTMKFIQDKLNDMGMVAFSATFQNSQLGQQRTQPITNVYGNVVADSTQCRISYHRKGTNEGKTTVNQNFTFSLRDVKKILVRPYEQANNEWLAATNSANGVSTISTSPQAFELSLRQIHGAENDFNLTDEDLAERLAKAFTHAVELCGGGTSKEPF